MDSVLFTAQAQAGFPVLATAVSVPFIAAIVLFLGFAGKGARALALAVGSVLTALAVLVTLVFETDHVGMQLSDGIGPLRLAVDGISVLFIPLTAVLTLLCVLATSRRHWDRARREGQNAENAEGRYYAAILLLSSSLLGAFTAADTRLFWLFMTIEALPAWYLLQQFGSGSLNRAAARDYAVVMAMGAGLSLIGLELLVGYVGSSDVGMLSSASVPAGSQGVVFILLALAFGIRAPVFPFHGWLPKVLEHGPAMGLGVFLVGLKVGTYGFLRFVIVPFPEAAADYGWIVASLAAIGAVYGGVMALVQTDLRRLLAYASVAHMGVIIIGLFSLNAHGVEGGLLQMLTIGMAVAGLYILSSFISDRVETPDVQRLGSLTSKAPWLAAAFILTALGAVGMPGTSGFNGEHLVVIGAYEAHPVFALLVGASTVLTAAYLLRFFQRAFMDQSDAATRHVDFLDLNSTEKLIASTMAGMILVVGLYTGPFISLTRASVEQVIERLPGHGPATEHATTEDKAALGSSQIASAATKPAFSN